MDFKNIVPADIKTVHDLAKLPVLTKNDVRKHQHDLLADNVASMKVSWAKTGGTTGEPMKIARNVDCVAMSAACMSRGLAWGGLTPELPRVRLFGGSLGLDRESFTKRVGTYLRRELFLAAFELRTDTIRMYVEKIRQSKSRFMIGYASAIFRFAKLAKEANEKIEFDAVFPTAELLLPEWKKTIRDVLKCEVLPYYGSGEVHSLGFCKPGSSCYFIPEEHSFIEILGPDGLGQEYGEGRFAVTDLDNYAMPIVRYVNGDAGKGCPAFGNYPFSRIERLDGRYNSLLMTDTGELISGVIGTHVFRHTTTVERYQIIQEEPLRVRIIIVPKGQFSDNDRALILSLFSQYLGNKVKISVETNQDIPVPPSGKSVFVINRCLEAKAAGNNAASV